MAEDNGLGGVFVDDFVGPLKKGIRYGAPGKDLGFPPFWKEHEKLVHGCFQVCSIGDRSTGECELQGGSGLVRFEKVSAHSFRVHGIGDPMSRILNSPAF